MKSHFERNPTARKPSRLPEPDRSARWGITTESLAAYTFRCQRHSVGLGPPNERRPIGDYEFASGVLIEWHGRTFVATADHFLDEVQPEKVHVLFPADKGFKISTSLDEHKPRLLQKSDLQIRLATPLQIRSHARSRKKNLDIAVLEVARDLVPSWSEVYRLPSDHPISVSLGSMTVLVAMPAAVTAVKKELRNPIIRRGWGA